LGPALTHLDLGFANFASFCEWLWRGALRSFTIRPAEVQSQIDLSQNTNLHSLTIHTSSVTHARRPTIEIFDTASADPLAVIRVLRKPIKKLTIVIAPESTKHLRLKWDYLSSALEVATPERLRFIVHFAADVEGIEEALRAQVPAYDACESVDMSVLHTTRIFTHRE
jgi:hypothetical protein